MALSGHKLAHYCALLWSLPGFCLVLAEGQIETIDVAPELTCSEVLTSWTCFKLESVQSKKFFYKYLKNNWNFKLRVSLSSSARLFLPTVSLIESQKYFLIQIQSQKWHCRNSNDLIVIKYLNAFKGILTNLLQVPEIRFDVQNINSSNTPDLFFNSENNMIKHAWVHWLELLGMLAFLQSKTA